MNQFSTCHFGLTSNLRRRRMFSLKKKNLNVFWLFSCKVTASRYAYLSNLLFVLPSDHPQWCRERDWNQLPFVISICQLCWAQVSLSWSIKTYRSESSRICRLCHEMLGDLSLHVSEYGFFAWRRRNVLVWTDACWHVQQFTKLQRKCDFSSLLAMGKLA